MKCKQCPFSLLCLSGKLTAQNIVYLCPHCGNFFVGEYGGFKCEKRQMTPKLQRLWKQVSFYGISCYVTDPANPTDTFRDAFRDALYIKLCPSCLGVK